MNYCTFKYRIDYEDGQISKGWSPYRGDEVNSYVLTRFVNQCFQLSKPARHITISDIFKISDATLWLAHVQHTVEYKYLIASRVFTTGGAEVVEGNAPDQSPQ